MDGKRVLPAPDVNPAEVNGNKKQRHKHAKRDHPYLRILFYFFITFLLILFATAATCTILKMFGLESMLILFVATSAVLAGWCIRWLYKSGRLTLSHILVIWMVWTGTVLGGASYYLSYIGKTANLETLSRYIMVEVVAGVGGYFVKSGVEFALRQTKGPSSADTCSPGAVKHNDDVVRDI